MVRAAESVDAFGTFGPLLEVQKGGRGPLFRQRPPVTWLGNPPRQGAASGRPRLTPETWAVRTAEPIATVEVRFEKMARNKDSGCDVRNAAV